MELFKKCCQDFFFHFIILNDIFSYATHGPWSTNGKLFCCENMDKILYSSLQVWYSKKHTYDICNGSNTFESAVYCLAAVMNILYNEIPKPYIICIYYSICH